MSTAEPVSEAHDMLLDMYRTWIADDKEAYPKPETPLAQLLARLAALSHVQAPAPVAAPVQEWQDISTAPKDGSWVLLYWPTMSICMYPAVGFHHGDEYGWELSQDRDYGEIIPTHWMLLPPSPALRALQSGEGE